MAIKCALSTEQLEFVYGLSKKAIQAKLDKGQSFNVDSFMKYLYERIEKVGDRDRAAQFLAFTPAIIEQVVLNNFAQQVDQVEGFDKISTLKVKWADPNTAISNVINTLEQTKTDLRIQGIINQLKEGIVEDQPISQSTFDYGTTTRFKSAAILSGTLASYIPGAGKFQSEEADKERRGINKTLSAIADNLSLQNTVTEYPKYQGVNIRLRATNLGDFINNNVDNFNGLDSITKKSIATSRTLVKRGVTKKGVAQVNERVIMLVADEQGNPLLFNHKTGDIVPSNDPKGKFAFQEMRTVRKTGTNSYSLRDIYNMEDKTLSSEKIAEIRSKNDKKLSNKDALNQVNDEFKEYYNLQQAALKQDVMLDFLGMTQGIDSVATGKKFSLGELINEGLLTKEDIKKTLRVLSIPENDFREGRTILKLDGNYVELVGSTINDNIAKQLQSVLFSSDLSYEVKKTFYNQFLNDPKTQGKYRKNQVLFEDSTKKIHIATYKETDPLKNPDSIISYFIIEPSGEVVNKKGESLSKDKSSTEFFNSVRKVLNSGDGQYLNYNQKLVKGLQDFQIFENGELVDSDYIDFLIDLKPIVSQPPSNIGFFNKQMLFQRHSKDSLQGMAKALPIEQRFIQAEENEYLHDIILEPNAANVPQLNPKYKGKLIYVTPGLFNQAEFGDNVVHSNDIAIDLIATIPMAGKTFRAINDGESKPDYIFAFSKTGYKTHILDPMVKNRIKQLTEQGVTVVTETQNFIKDVDLVVLGDRNNSGVASVNLNESFFQKELNATEEYLTNLNNPPVAPKIKVTPQQNKTIIEPKVEGGPDTNESNNKPESKPPKGGGLTLFRDGKLNPDVVTAEEIKRANEFWAGPLGQKFEKDGFTLNRAANLVNSDAYANFVVSGTNLGIKQINISNKGTMIDVYHESFHVFTQLYLTKEQKIALYEEVRNFTDAKGNQPHLTKSYLELEELLAEDFRTYMKDQNVKKDAPVRNSLFRRIVNFLKTLLGITNASEFKDAYNLVQEAQLDIMAIPTVKELFENLKIGNPKFLNKYQASVDNAMFFELDRGPLFVDKINNERKNRTALSKRDGDVVVESMDSITSDFIDSHYDENETNPSKISEIKGLTMSALLEETNIPYVYKHIKSELQEELGKKKTEYLKSVGREDQAISKIETFEDLEKSAAATLITKEGTPNKYVFLESQIDDFNQFNSDFKAGERVKGEEWMGIKILGNYFTHTTIKDGDVPAQVVIVSRIEDAQNQYANYVKGGAEEYVGVDINKKVEDSNLEQSQINMLNNIRILQTAINEFGDPDYIANGTKPSGMIAYYLNNSIFELTKTNYFTEDQDVSEDIIANQEEGQSLNPDKDSFKKSLYDLADKEVIYILKSLHETDGSKVNSLGFRKLADFRKTWNLVSKLVGGVQSREVMFEILENESENIPILKQLTKHKLAAPEGITSDYALDVSNSFWHTFSRPSAKFWVLEINQDFTGEIDIITGRPIMSDPIFVVTQAKIDTKKIISESKARFSIAKNEYMNNIPGKPATLNLQKVRANFFNEKGGLKEKSKVQFLRTLGFKLDNTQKVYDQLDTAELTSDINNLANLVKDLYNLASKPLEEQTQEQIIKGKALVKRFNQSPISFLQDESFIEQNIDLLKTFKNIESLRSDSIVRTLADIQATYGFDTPGESITLPDGESAHAVANHSSATSIILGVNDLKGNLDEAYEVDGYLSFLNPNVNRTDLPYNPLTARNKVLQTMFPKGKRDLSKEMQFSLIAGTEYQTNGSRDTGIVTADLVARDRHFQAYNMMLQSGVGEFIKHSDKRSSFGILLEKKKKWGKYDTGKNKNLWIDIDKFESTDEGHELAFNVFLLDYIANEVDRIQYFNNNPKELERNTGYNQKLSNGRAAGLSFVLTDSLMSDESKEALYEVAESKNPIDIVDLIQNDPKYSELRKNLIKETKQYFEAKTNYNLTSLQGLLTLNQELAPYTEDTLASAFTYNNFINKVEMSNLLNGDLAQFTDFTKRVPGSTSDGNSFLYDKDAMKFIDNVFQGEGISTYATSIGKENFTMEGGTLNTGVIKDPIRVSIYLDEMEAAWAEDYIEQGFTPAQAKKKAKEDGKPYTEMEEADGAAFLTFDAYRVLRKLANKWKPEHQALYEDIVAGKPVNAADVKRFFPVYKLHNYGPLMNSGMATTSMYKFAVAPIIPSVAIEGTELKKLHDKMVESDIQMVTFKTGSKVSNITSKKNAKGKADDIFENIRVI